MWLLPSRGRPLQCQRFFDAFAATGATTGGFLWLDSDDAHQYAAIKLPDGWSVIVHERIGLGPLQNEFFRLHPDLPWYGMIADDIVPTSQRWDTKLIESAGLDGVAYGDDTIQREKQCTHGVLGGDFVRALGFIILPGLHGEWGDNVINEVARRKGVLRYLPDVKLEHWHWANGRALKDDTYLKTFADQDREIYNRWYATLGPA